MTCLNQRHFEQQTSASERPTLLAAAKEAGLDVDAATAFLNTDELVDDAFVSDATWKALTEHFDTQQSIDLVFAVGQYNLVSMALNTLGVQVEEENLRFALDD